MISAATWSTRFPFWRARFSSDLRMLSWISIVNVIKSIISCRLLCLRLLRVKSARFGYPPDRLVDRCQIGKSRQLGYPLRNSFVRNFHSLFTAEERRDRIVRPLLRDRALADRGPDMVDNGARDPAGKFTFSEFQPGDTPVKMRVRRFLANDRSE